MSNFSGALKEIRSRLGYESAKTFYQYLQVRGVECNYPYYMKIEKGDAFPSSNIVNQIAKGLPEAEAVKLIRSYCADQFQGFKFLFDADEEASPEDKKTAADGSQGQRQLSPRQVHVLASHKNLYHIFLLCTLARRPLQHTELLEFFPKKALESALDSLLKEKILVEFPQGFSTFAPDVRFPKDKAESFKKDYEKLDLWDVEFSEQFELQEILSKMLIRRISFRYLGLISKQLEILFDLVRSSDEVDTRHNSQVIHLQVTLKRGSLPG